MGTYATIPLRFAGAGTTKISIVQGLPTMSQLLASAGVCEGSEALLVADTHTEVFAREILGGTSVPLCVLEPGEAGKNWQTVEKILDAAREAGLGRDALFVGVGGGVITDITGFAASVYKRGARLAFVSTSLLGMVDAAVGGKTGFDLFGLKNIIGTFYPASAVFMPLAVLQSLPPAELHSGYAELIKSVVLDSACDDASAFLNIKRAKQEQDEEALASLICTAIRIKGSIVEADPYERSGQRALLNLGHTFGHALESAAGLGVLTHGESVAWGMARACELGVRLGITPVERARALCELLFETGYELRSPHPAMASAEAFMTALTHDKKKSGGILNYIVPARRGAQVVPIEREKIAQIEDVVFRSKSWEISFKGHASQF